MCSSTSTNIDRCNTHIIRFHRNDANFIVNCCVSDCQYVSRSWNAYKMHVSRVHTNREVDIDDHDDVNMEDGHDDVDLGNVDDGDHADRGGNHIAFDQNFIDATYLLALKVDHHLSDRGMQSVIINTTDLVSSHLIAYREKIRDALVAN